MIRNVNESRLWTANEGWWTHAGAHIRWLRPDSHRVHMVASGLEDEVDRLLDAAEYTRVRLDGERVTNAEELIIETKRVLRLWDYCGIGWDSWRDCLSDLNDIWDGVDRLGLLWSKSDVLMKNDLQSWLVAITIMEETSRSLQTKPQLMAGLKLSEDFVPYRLMVFELFCFVDGLEAQHP